jgi:hypothetical protein
MAPPGLGPQRAGAGRVELLVEGDFRDRSLEGFLLHCIIATGVMVAGGNSAFVRRNRIGHGVAP